MDSGGDSCSQSPEVEQAEANSESDQMDSEDSKERGEPPALASPVDRCIMILRRAKSDTEKFAALLMVTKLIKAEELEETNKKRVMDAVGLPFLARLMRTSDVPEGCPPYMFKSIALTILTSFISCCMGSAVLHGLIPVLSEIISKPELYETDLTLIKDAYQCLKCIASDKCGSKAIIDFEAVGTLVEAYIEGNFGSDSALEILLMVLSEEGVRTWEDEPEAFTKLMSHTTHEFALDHSEFKFKLCDVLIDLLHSQPQTCEIGQQEWKVDLHKGLSDIIFSKLGREQRNRGLRLAGAVLESLGVSWVLQAVDSGTEGKGRQLLLMMVHLSCIEVRMGLEDKTFEEAVSVALPTTACYTILELAIIFLVNGAVDFEQKQKQQLYAALKGAFNAVLKFLQGASLEDAVLESEKNHLFVCATIRVLCAWLAEETAANKDEVYQTLPFIIKTCKHNFDHNKKILSKSKKKGHSRSFYVKENKEKLPDILRFLLPGLCHLTAEDIPRQILIDLELENLLFEYFSFHWNSIKDAFGPQGKEEVDIPADKIQSACEAMGTISNIFMNIVVQEPERVQSDVFYFSLLKFIFCKLPDIPLEVCHLKLSGNMCILGLMILRHQHPNVKSTDFTIFRFVQSTVRFLWDAHNVEESRDYATLVVSSKYESHWGSLMDLWFLGMHTLSLLLPTIPWLCDFLMESEWPQTIVATLMTVREGGLDVGLKSAFEDFLSLLCKSSKPANTILQEKGIIQVATWLEGQGWSPESSWQVTRRYLHAFREEPAPPHPADQEGLDKWRRDLWETVLPPEYEHLERVYSIWKAERLSHLQLKPSVKQMLEDLGEHFSLGLITNGPSVAQWEKIRETGCQTYFGSLVVSEDHDVEKPDKALFDVVCGELQVKPRECLMVGDKLETDVQGGVNAGMVAVWLNGRGRTAPKDLQPDYTIDQILDLTTVLRDLSRDLEICTSS